MDRELELELLDECLALFRERRPYMTEEETLIPVRDYLDPELFAREREVLFRRAMNLVAHASELAAPGDFVTREVAGTPVLLARDEQRRARAFLNVCRHRGATVELRESGRCKKFVCPYHAWTYELDGRLSHVRHREGFPGLRVEQTSLVELSCEEVGGFLWVCPDPARRDARLDEHARALLAEIEGLCGERPVVFTSTTREWNANWKLLVDGGLEAYHFRVAHRNSIGGFFGDNISTYSFVGDHIRSVLPRVSIVELAEQPRSEWHLRDHAHLTYTLCPNATVLTQLRHYELVLMEPVAIDRTRVRILTIAPRGPEGWSDKARGYLEANHRFTVRTLDEDFELSEQIQRGLATGANEHFRFARFEGALTEWHRRLEARRISAE